MSRKKTDAGKDRGRAARLFPRLLLGLGAVLVALVIAEIALRLVDFPRIYEPHSSGTQFAFTNLGDADRPFYVNQPGRITFRYDGNPRGYFDEENQVHHDVNPSGFRGPAFKPKADGAFRIVFLGDSFTFGEGVRNEDVFAEVTARLLRKEGRQVESCNLGVGGYNTTQAAEMLETVGFGLQPDLVVLGYTINDAEPPLFRIDPASGQPVRREREQFIESEAAPQKPPSSPFYRLRIAQIFWQFRRQRELTGQTIDYYQSINQPTNEGRIESERALRAIISQCRERGIPCIVVMFPLLFDLTGDHPFKEIHERTGTLVKDAGAGFIDLLPELTGKNARRLIVHPTDQHPNEAVHEITGKLLAGEIAGLPGFSGDP